MKRICMMILTACLAAVAHSVTSVDIFDDFIEAAKEKLSDSEIENVSLHCMDAMSELPNGEYDAIAVTGAVSDLLSAGGFGDASCLVSGLVTPSTTDGRMPGTGDGFYYVTRARNVCGNGTHGPGRGELDASPPCP